MNFTIAVCFRDMIKEGFVARITMPDGKLMNMFTFLNFINGIRTGNMSIAKVNLHLVGDFIKDFKYMIMRDNRTACKPLESFGAMQKPADVVLPDIDKNNFPYLQILSDTDDLTLQKNENNSQKLFLNIHGAVEGSPSKG